MISSSEVKYMLKEAKSRAKQKEYKIELEDYPHYRTDFKDLDYSAVYVLSKYSDAIYRGDNEAIQEFYKDLRLVSQYFDAAINIVRENDYNIDYLLSGACAYFLSDDFGSAKALLEQLKQKDIEDAPRKLTFAIMWTALERYGKDDLQFGNPSADAFFADFLHFLDTGLEIDIVYDKWSEYKRIVFNSGDIFGAYYIDILVAVLKQTENHSAWKLLPSFSGIEVEKWRTYLTNKRSSKMLWSAQRIIGEAGILSGKSGIIQLPTGVGKTKSLELIIRSAFIADRTNAVIVITPLRALCGEIESDLQHAFGKSVGVNQFSDVLQEDFSLDMKENEKNIVVCTPEKLKYILHHNKDFLEDIGLFVFDEGHMFDSAKRGAAYELLVTTIKMAIKDRGKQCIFISAVMSNAKQIGQWLFEGEGVIASSENIKTTEKNIGFVSLKQNNVDYYADGDFDSKNYWVQNVFEQFSLLTLTGNVSKKIFPEDNAKDISLYLMNLLTPSGAVAIYISRPDWITGYIKRIIEAKVGGINFDQLSCNINVTEQEKLKYLFGLHYGGDFEYAQGVELGVVPHYSDLEEGLKLSVEYALRNGLMRNVLCTSTLAQGVNIPIRYLLITAFDGYRRDMKARELQNLVGRTARSGMHTEGSVIVTDVGLYAKRYDSKAYRYKTGGKYNWEKKTGLFNPKNSEPCGSTIHAIIEPFFIHKDYELLDLKDDILNALEAGIDIENLHQTKIEACNEITEAYNIRSTITSSIEKYFDLVKHALEAIESHLSFLIYINIKEDLVEKLADDLCVSTLAYALATDEERKYLIKLFRVIAKNVAENTGKMSPAFQAKAMTGIQNTIIILDWISNNKTELEDKSIDTIAEHMLSLYQTVENRDAYEGEVVIAILKLWIDGEPLCSIFDKTQTILPDRQNIICLEKFCHSSLSYAFSFLVGNIIDLFEKISDKTKHQLQIFQKRLKYGLKTITAINIFEKGLSDRLIAEQIANLLGDDNISEMQIVDALKGKKTEIKEILKSFPSLFTAEFTRICR